jgi:hypothetical protein
MTAGSQLDRCRRYNFRVHFNGYEKWVTSRYPDLNDQRYFD